MMNVYMVFLLIGNVGFIKGNDKISENDHILVFIYDWHSFDLIVLHLYEYFMFVFFYYCLSYRV